MASASATCGKTTVEAVTKWYMIKKGPAFFPLVPGSLRRPSLLMRRLKSAKSRASFEVSTIGDAEEFFTNYGAMTSLASDTDDFAIDWRPPPNVFAKMTTRVISYSQTQPTILPCVGNSPKILLEGRGTASSPRPGRAPDQFLANRLRQLLCGVYRRIWRFWFHSYSAKLSLSLPTQPPYHN